MASHSHPHPAQQLQYTSQQQAAAEHQRHHQQQPLPAHSENVDEELRRIHLALTAVFSPHTPSHPQAKQQWWEQRQLADAYLTSFQTTPVSWMVCDRLLSFQDTSDDVSVQQQRRFFAAQTLHLKCRVAVNELPPESLPSLRDSLLQHLQNYTSAETGTASGSASGGYAALTTRLSMCIAALAVQMKWTTILPDLLKPLLQHQQLKDGLALQRAVVLSILHVLPEECTSDRLLLEDETIRYVMRDHFVANSPRVLDFLNSCMMEELKQEPQGDNVHAIERVLATLHLWIRHVPVDPTIVAASPLLLSSVQALSQPAYVDVAADCVVEVLRMYPSHHPNNDALVQTLVPILFQQLPLEAALRSDDEDVWKAYCRIVTEMGESYMSLILSSQAALPGNTSPRRMVEWVLQCSRISETEIGTFTHTIRNI